MTNKENKESKSSVLDDVEKLRAEALKNQQEAERIVRLYAKFPDLDKHTGRWKKVAYASKTVNSLVTDYEMRHNCGCCNDSPLEIWPYIDTPDGKVYSKPPRFMVGEKHWMSGDKPYDDWRAKVAKEQIPTAILDRIEAHFNSDRMERIALAKDS